MKDGTSYPSPEPTTLPPTILPTPFPSLLPSLRPTPFPSPITYFSIYVSGFCFGTYVRRSTRPSPFVSYPSSSYVLLPRPALPPFCRKNVVNSDSTCITAAAEFGYSFTDIVSDPDIAAGCVVMDGATSVFWNSYYSE